MANDVNETPQQAPTATAALRQALTDALGLPADTFLLEILLGQTMTPVVRCHFYPTAEAMQRAVVLFTEYQLVVKRPEEPVLAAIAGTPVPPVSPGA